MKKKRIILIGTTVVLFLIAVLSGIVLLFVLLGGFVEGYINSVDILIPLVVGAMALTGLFLLRKRISNLIGIS